MLLIDTQNAGKVRAMGAALRHRPFLRVRTADGYESTITLQLGKSTLGTGPKCTLQLPEPGVQPMHCLFVFDDSGLTVQRWADGTLLNGQPFEVAELLSGDRLTVGSVEIEVGDESSLLQTPADPFAATQLECGEPEDEPVAEHASVAPLDIADDEAVILEQLVGEIESVSQGWKDDLREIERLREGQRLARERCRRMIDALRGERQAKEPQPVEQPPAAAAGDAWRAESFAAARIPAEKNIAPHVPASAWELHDSSDESPWSNRRSEDELPVGSDVTEIATPVDSDVPTLKGGPSIWNFIPAEQDSVGAAEDEPDLLNKRMAGNWDKSFPKSNDSVSDVIEPSQFDADTLRTDGDDAASELPLTSLATTKLAEMPGSSESVPTRHSTPSYIERFAHLFPDEASADKTVKGASGSSIFQTPAEQSLAPAGPAIPPSAAKTASGGSEDEESIEDYMAKLMQRLRGDALCATPPPVPDEIGMKKSVSDEHDAGRQTPAIDLSEEPRYQPLSEAMAVPPTSPAIADRPYPRGQVQEWTPDLQAFRDIANETARRAIAVHATQTYRKSAVTKVIVSVLAAMTGLWLMLQTPDVKDKQFLSACVLLFVAAYWVGQTFQSFLESIRARGYDGPHYEGDDELREIGLPIDVDDRC